MRYSIGIHPRLQLNVRIIFFFKTLNCANQTQGSKQSKTSSMFQQGLSQSLAWQWHVRIGCSPDETCGATRPGRGAMKCAKTYSCNLLYGGAEIEHRISNKEHRMSKGWILLFAHSINYLCESIMKTKNSGIPNNQNLPACFSRASANLWPGSGFARIGCSPDETCGATRPERGAMKCTRTYS